MARTEVQLTLEYTQRRLEIMDRKYQRILLLVHKKAASEEDLDNAELQLLDAQYAYDLALLAVAPAPTQAPTPGAESPWPQP